MRSLMLPVSSLCIAQTRCEVQNCSTPWINRQRPAVFKPSSYKWRRDKGLSVSRSSFTHHSATIYPGLSRCWIDGSPNGLLMFVVDSTPIQTICIHCHQLRVSETVFSWPAKPDLHSAVQLQFPAQGLLQWDLKSFWITDDANGKESAVNVGKVC